MDEFFPVIIGTLWALLTVISGFMIIRLIKAVDHLTEAVHSLFTDIAVIKAKMGGGQ